jgi:hypothetical protein
MKKIIIFLLSAIAFTVVDDKNIDSGDTPALSVDKTSIAAASTAGSYAVAVTSNVAWAAAVDNAASAWCTLAPASSNGNDFFIEYYKGT